MGTRPNLLGDDSVFQAKARVSQLGLSRVLSRALVSSVIVLMSCNTVLALDINQANEAELDSVRGMGPALSAKVLKARAEGPFKNWPDLMKRVSGIRQNKAKQLSDQGLTIDGQAFATQP
jgi:competence protein ComEA